MATVKLTEAEVVEEVIANIADADRTVLRDNIVEIGGEVTGELARNAIAHVMLDCRQTVADEDMKKYYLTVIKKYMNGSRKISKDLAEQYVRLYNYIMQ